MIAVSYLPRRADGKLDMKLHISTFRNRGQDILANLGLPTDLSLATFAVAVLCQGNILHSFKEERWPYDASTSLGNRIGSLPSSEGWKKVLAIGRVLSPSPLPSNYQPRPQSLVSFSGGDPAMFQNRYEGW